jgi:hypothetical protein
MSRENPGNEAITGQRVPRVKLPAYFERAQDGHKPGCTI